MYPMCHIYLLTFFKTEFSIFQVFTDFREACSSLNDDIVNCLRESPINNSGNMTDAVKSVLGGSSNPFLQDSQMYELDDKHRNMNMKHVFGEDPRTYNILICYLRNLNLM